ncbi:MAG: hypothetical protein M3321_03260 [Actinomycetota bacterium]|nr:hypothetical protein [Actinomycetota bacterium]
MKQLLEEPLAWHSTIAVAASLIVAGALLVVFAASARAKLANRRRFAATVRRYDVVPQALAGPVVWLVAGVELALVPLLLATPLSPAGLYVASGALAAFALAVAINLVRGRSFDCGCSFARSYTPISWRHVASNVGLGVLCVVAAAATPFGATTSDPAPAVTVVAAAAFVTAIVRGGRELRRLTPYDVATMLVVLRRERMRAAPPPVPAGPGGR